jgi:2-polyprenyl-6-methoxyphenol hydroxylase-like FAD-dependent oxidoreductase
VGANKLIKTPILIVGAGPSGLMLSVQLHRYGAAHVIVDKKQGITDLSKALAVQARTMEQYLQLGIADGALAQGFVAETVRLIVNGRVRAKVPLGEIGAGLSPFPYVFILEQSRNEALLRDKINAQGGHVQWATEVADVRHSDASYEKGYGVTVRRSDGALETIECQYLAGCGGASSPVRHFLGMPFRGGTNEQLFFVADIEMEVELEKEGLLLAINESEFLAFFPMSGRQQYRAIGVLPNSVTNPDDFPFDPLQEHIEKNVGLPVKIKGHSWHAGYRVHHRIVDGFRSGNAFLVGDAAHIHSPAGGQGMNTGLGDAVNLGWKLAGVVNGWCEPEILDTYNQERRPFGVQLVHTTDQAFTVMVSKSWLPRLLRTHVLPVLMRTFLSSRTLRRLMFRTISQTRITYRNSALSDGSRCGSIRSGDRFPWFEWESGNSYDWLKSPGYVVLNFRQAPPHEPADWKGPVTRISVDGAAASAAIAAGLPRHGSVVVRPDMHVAKIVAGK